MPPTLPCTTRRTAWGSAQLSERKRKCVVVEPAPQSTHTTEFPHDPAVRAQSLMAPGNRGLLAGPVILPFLEFLKTGVSLDSNCGTINNLSSEPCFSGPFRGIKHIPTAVQPPLPSVSGTFHLPRLNPPSHKESPPVRPPPSPPQTLSTASPRPSRKCNHTARGSSSCAFLISLSTRRSKVIQVTASLRIYFLFEKESYSWYECTTSC